VAAFAARSSAVAACCPVVMHYPWPANYSKPPCPARPEGMRKNPQEQQPETEPCVGLRVFWSSGGKNVRGQIPRLEVRVDVRGIGVLPLEALEVGDFPGVGRLGVSIGERSRDLFWIKICSLEEIGDLDAPRLSVKCKK